MRRNKFYTFKEIGEDEDLIREYNSLFSEDYLTAGLFWNGKQYFKEWLEDSFKMDIIDQYERRTLLDILDGLPPKKIREKEQKRYENTITIDRETCPELFDSIVFNN
jgi:hypothetical protein